MYVTFNPPYGISASSTPPIRHLRGRDELLMSVGVGPEGPGTASALRLSFSVVPGGAASAALQTRLREAADRLAVAATVDEPIELWLGDLIAPEATT